MGGVVKKPRDEKVGLAVSLAIKSIRIGWPEGLMVAEKITSPAMVRSLLWAQAWEDTYPGTDELSALADEIGVNDYVAICGRESHHGQPGVTRRWYDFKFAEFEYGQVYARIKRIEQRAQVTPRVVVCAGAWLEMEGGKPGLTRAMDETEFVGVPMSVWDMHCTWRGQRGGLTMLSGTWEMHVKISENVRDYGWEKVRKDVHSQGVVPGTEEWADLIARPEKKVEELKQLRLDIDDPEPEPPKWWDRQ